MQSKSTIVEDVLSEHHREMLEVESRISPTAIKERGYFTATDPDEITALGFKDYQARVPALVIPVRGVDRELRFLRIRPDEPRLAGNKVVKYEQPEGAPPALDIPRRCQPYLTDTSRRLWFVEGEKKADCLASQGEIAVALLGVWSWKANGLPLRDLDYIHLVGREVIVGFDSDATRKIQVRRAEKGLAQYLQGRGAL